MQEKAIIVAALYQFVRLEDYQKLREPLLRCLLDNRIKGTLLLALEGINGTVSGSRTAIDNLRHWFAQDGRFNALEYKESSHFDSPFFRTKVKLKKEIVTLGVAGVDPNQQVGTYVEPQDWNALIGDPDVLLIDTRNDYEVAIGSFNGAINPKMQTFREFPAWVKANADPKRHKKVAMFCTGGIRCEKASSYMLEQGFSEVFHLKGGILNYLAQVPEQRSTWQGDCFVFDQRVSVGHNLQPGQYSQCHACRHPLSAQDRASVYYQEGISCPHCFDNLPEKTRQSARQRQHQVELARLHNRPCPIGQPQ